MKILNAIDGYFIVNKTLSTHLIHSLLYSVAVTILTTVVTAQPTLPQFFDDLYGYWRGHYEQVLQDDYQSFCSNFQLAPDNGQNHDQYFRLNFYHELLSNSRAYNFAADGILHIPYVWHWVSPNPRHGILYLPDQKALKDMPPGSEFGRYKSFADIDRIPSLFLGDLITEKPQYYHSQTGEFYTFGWCSEREMTFNLLMSYYDFSGKIRQTGRHTRSEFWISFSGVSGDEVHLIAVVDNTFGTIRWHPAPSDTELTAWLEDIGEGQQIDWYNQMAYSAQQQELVANLKVPLAARGRITNAARLYFQNRSTAFEQILDRFRNGQDEF